MATQKVKPDPGTMEGQVPALTRGETYAKVGAYGLVTVVFVVVAAAGFALWNSGRMPDPVALGRPSVAGPVETRPTETGPAETAPPPALASAAPDVVTQRPCSDGARWRLELEDRGDQVPHKQRIKVRYEVHRSPPGDQWQIRMWDANTKNDFFVFKIWRGVRVASDSGAFAVQFLHGDEKWFRIRAIDSATGEVCEGWEHNP